MLTLGALALLTQTSQADVLAAWDVNSSTGYGISPLAPATSATNTTIGSLTRGSGVITSAGTAAARAWGGTGWNVADAATAIAAEKFVSFSVMGNAGYKVSFSSIDRLDYRRSGSGATSGTIQYQVGSSGTFTDITTVSYSSSAGAGASLPAIDLSGITALQQVPASTPVTFRIVNFGGSGATGTWYIYDVVNATAADLSISGTVVSEGLPGPTISNFTPTSGGVGTTVTITGTNFGSSPTVSFNGTAAPGATVNGAGTSISVNVPTGATSGTITVTAAGSVTSANPFTVLAQPTLTVNLANPSVLENAGAAATTATITASTAPASDLTVTLTSSDLTEATVPASVTILAGQTVSSSFNIAAVADGVFDADAAVTITAAATGYTSGTAVLTVQNVDITSTSVVINKYLNGPDLIELLVVGTDAANSTADMRGMIIKDHSTSMTADTGGKYTFNAITLFESVKAGTLITLNTTATSADIDPVDFTLNLGLLDTTYFTPITGTVDIAGVEMVSIKSAGSGGSGSAGTIHSLAGGTEGSVFTGAPTPKLIATLGSATGQGVVANNSTSSLADFNGTDATGSVPLTASSFGLANNLANNAYIRRLRGYTNLDGAGLATLTNGTAASPFQGKNIFQRNQTGQTVSIQVIADATPGVIASVRLTVPASFGIPQAGLVSVSGPGAGTGTVSVTGQQVTVSGTVVSTTNSATINIGGLNIPVPALVTDDGRYTFAMATAGTAGTLTAAAASPAAVVTIPVEFLRDVTPATGVSLDAGKVVAVVAVCSEENLNTAGTSAYIQEGDYGINVFSSSLALNLVRGRKYAITGQVTQFNGLTEIVVTSVNNVVDLAADTSPAPITLTVADFLLSPEAYEGRVVRINGLAPTAANTGVWGAGATVSATDSTGNIDIRIQAGSTAITAPNYPASIIGIIGQFDSSNPFTAGYQIMPRDPNDILAGSGYAAWVAEKFPAVTDPLIIGFNADPDGDGVPNGIEFAFASSPTLGNASPLIAILIATPGRVDFNHRRAKSLPSNVVISYQWSSDLTNWFEAGFSDALGNAVTVGVDTIDTNNPAYDVITAHASLAEGELKKIFVRAKVTSP